MRYKSLIQYFILLVIICYPIFGNLDSIPIRQYDEGRLAINAYEMNRYGDFIVTHYQGEPDMWSTKPPLMIWLQVLFMKLFGVGEFAVRLPSAIAALLTCLFLTFFSVRYLRDSWFGIITSTVLITSLGYMTFHASRTGDYDSLLTLFTTIYALLFFLYCESDNLKYLYLTFITIILAALTKGVGGMLFLPVLLGYAVFKRKVLELLKGKHLYLGFGMFLLFVVGYYLLREHYNPGFIKAVRENELGGRYFHTIENHKEGFWFYYHVLVKHYLKYWCWLVPLGVVAGLFHKDRIYRDITIYSTSLVVFYFLVISVAQTKLEWYLVPIYPFMAIIIGVFIHFVFTFIRNLKLIHKQIRINVLHYVFLLAIFIYPLIWTYSRTIESKLFRGDEEYYRINYYLKDAIKGGHDLNGYTLIHQGYYVHNLFYINMLKDKGVNVNLTSDWKNLNIDDSVIVHQKEVKDSLKLKYYLDTLRKESNIYFYKIKGRLNHD
jgi:4-amino-4-deoxy-L-arabinose transferase-like glycosyltransferase